MNSGSYKLRMQYNAYGTIICCTSSLIKSNRYLHVQILIYDLQCVQPTESVKTPKNGPSDFQDTDNLYTMDKSHAPN